MLACHAGDPGSIPGRCTFFRTYDLRKWSFFHSICMTYWCVTSAVYIHTFIAILHYKYWPVALVLLFNLAVLLLGLAFDCLIKRIFKRYFILYEYKSACQFQYYYCIREGFGVKTALWMWALTIWIGKNMNMHTHALPI